MIKVYFNKYQFSEGEDKGIKNIDDQLHENVKYVESTNNKIVIGDSPEDKEDWEKFSGSMKQYMAYFEEVLMQRVEEADKAKYADNNKLFEDNFVIVQR